MSGSSALCLLFYVHFIVYTFPIFNDSPRTYNFLCRISWFFQAINCVGVSFVKNLFKHRTTCSYGNENVLLYCNAVRCIFLFAIRDLRIIGCYINPTQSIFLTSSFVVFICRVHMNVSYAKKKRKEQRFSQYRYSNNKPVKWITLFR